MTTWYVDLDATYTDNIANSGIASGSPMGGVCGLQRIVSGIAIGANTFSTGESIFIIGSTYNAVVKLVKITTAAGSGSFTPGNTVTECANTDGTGAVANVSGRVVWRQSTTIVWIEDTGSVAWTAIGTLYVFESAGIVSGDITAVAYPGVNVNVSGTTAGCCKLIGCDASWNELAEGTRITLNPTGCSYALDLTTIAAPYWELKHLASDGTSSNSGIYPNGSSYIYDCKCSNGSARGFRCQSSYSIFHKCVADNNGTIGFNNTTIAKHTMCVAYNNGTDGILTNNASVFLGCLSYNNTQNGINIAASIGVTIMNCVINGNTRNGIISTAGAINNMILGNRITNNDKNATGTYYGINDGSAAGLNREDYNVFYNPLGAGNRNNIEAGVNSLTAADTTEVGYVDVGALDFNLTADAILRSTAIILPS